MNTRTWLLTTGFILQTSALFAQDITGTWQGAIHTTRDIREVIRISKDGNVIKAVLFPIDSQPGQSLPSPPVILQGNAVQIQFPGIGGAYRGTLSADGNSILGLFLRGATELTLNLVRATAATAWETPAAPLPEKPMPEKPMPEKPMPEKPMPEKPMPMDAKPTFELATIKHSPPDARGAASGMDPGGRFTAHNLSLKSLMLLAYRLHPRQIQRGPAW